MSRTSTRMRVGNIPTPVGKTARHACFNVRCEKHPHARGEDRCLGRQQGCALETSPRPWGRQHDTLVLTCDVRNIPTPVGKTLSTMCTWPCSGKHPHARGEDFASFVQPLPHQETSPRPWGRRFSVSSSIKKNGNIPTPVGKTTAGINAAVEAGETSPRPWGRQQYINFFQTATTIFCGPFNSRFLKIHQKSCYFFS